jgi:hypothetical protein
MSNQLVINATPYETRVALLEDGMLVEGYIERTKGRSIVGNIYKGKVIRVLPGMQAAFVDIGLGSPVIFPNLHRSKTCCVKDKKSSCKSQRSPLGQRERGLRPTSRFQVATSFSCPRLTMWVFPGGLRTRAREGD